MRARENPLPLLVWVAAAAMGGLASGAAVAAVKKKASTPAINSAPAISASQPAPSTVSTAAQRAMAAAQTTAQEEANNLAVHQALLTNTTYQLNLEALGSQPVSSNIVLKVGDTIRIVPSFAGMPPFPLVPTYTMSQGGDSILSALGSSMGIDMTYAAISVGTCFITIVLRGGPANAIFATFVVTTMVSAS